MNIYNVTWGRKSIRETSVLIFWETYRCDIWLEKGDAENCAYYGKRKEPFPLGDNDVEFSCRQA